MRYVWKIPARKECIEVSVSFYGIVDNKDTVVDIGIICHRLVYKFCTLLESQDNKGLKDPRGVVKVLVYV
jgi:hypothetical protein